MLFAHRGASTLAPENTMEAFDLAVRLGVDILELDVHLSADGEVVVIHDANVRRTTNGAGLVRQQTYADLRALDAGCRFTTRDGGRHFADRGVVIPRLEDVLRAFPKVGFNIEIKQRSVDMIPTLLSVLARVGTADVLLTAGNSAIMQDLEMSRPGCALGLSRRQVGQLMMAAYTGQVPPTWSGRALQIPMYHGVIPVAHPRLLQVARKAGLEVHVFGINQPQVAERWLKLGVEGIMTDDPGALVGLFAPLRGDPAPRRGVRRSSEVQ